MALPTTAATINKAQSQSFEKVGLYMTQNKPIFGYAPLYVALSRAVLPSYQGVKIKITGAKDKNEDNISRNIVHSEVLNCNS
jgi:hypothetical protein